MLRFRGNQNGGRRDSGAGRGRNRQNRQDRGRPRGDDRRDSSGSRDNNQRGGQARDFQRKRDNVSGQQRRITAVPNRQLKAREWLRAYADHNGECVETFGKGATALSPMDMKKFLNANNSEFKRRMGFALSFMCATFRSAWSVIKQLPDGLQDLATSRKRRGCLLRALADLRVLLSTKSGKRFRRACDYLDSKHACKRETKDAEMHVRNWLAWIEETKGLTRVLMTLANCTSRLFLTATWGLESQAVVGDLSAWAVGFPSDKDVVAGMPRAVRAWLRKPVSRKLLIKALTESAKEHVVDAGSKKRDWADYDDDADDKGGDDSGSDGGSEAQAGDGASSPSAGASSARPQSPGAETSGSASDSSAKSDGDGDAAASDDSSSSSHADREASKKSKGAGSRKVSFAAAKKKFKKASAAGKLDNVKKRDKAGKPRAGKDEIATPATSRAKAAKTPDRRSKSRPPVRAAEPASPAQEEDDDASAGTADSPTRVPVASTPAAETQSDGDDDDEALVLEPPQPPPRKGKRTRAGHDAEPQIAQVSEVRQRASSSKKRPSVDVKSIDIAQSKASLPGAGHPADAERHLPRRSALSGRRSGTAAVPPVAEDTPARADHRRADPAQSAVAQAAEHKRRRAASPAAPTLPKPRVPASAAPPLDDARPAPAPAVPATADRVARSRSRPKSRSRPRSLPPAQAPPPLGSPIFTPSRSDDEGFAPVYAARQPAADAPAGDAASRHRSATRSSVATTPPLPAQSARRGVRASKTQQPETVDAIKKLLVARARVAPPADSAVVPQRQAPHLLDSDDESRPPAESFAWQPLAPPPHVSDTEDAQPPASAQCTYGQPWPLSAIVETKLLLDAAEEKIAADSLGINDFEDLMQSIPPDVRAAAGIGLKVSDRTRLPRNIHAITSRVGDVIRDAFAAHGGGVSSSACAPPDASASAPILSQSPPPGQPEGDTLLD